MLKNLVLEFEDILALVFLFHLECHVHSQLAVERLINVAYSSISKLAKVEIVLPQAKDSLRRRGGVGREYNNYCAIKKLSARRKLYSFKLPIRA